MVDSLEPVADAISAYVRPDACRQATFSDHVFVSMAHPTIYRNACQRPFVAPVRRNTSMETIGARVRRLRESKGIERKDLARAVGFSYTGLSDLESGKAKSTTKLRRLADALGVTGAYLETGKDQQAPTTPAAPSHSQSLRLDPEIVSSAHAALSGMYKSHGLTYPQGDVARFVHIYEKYAMRKAGVSEAELLGAGLGDTDKPQGAESERKDGVRDAGDDKRTVARRVRPKA